MFSEFLDTHNLYALLAPREARLVFPPATDRETWAAAPSAMRGQIAAEADRLRAEPYPMLTATQFLAYTRNGSRKAYENPHFARRNKLMAAALNTCLGNAQDLDAVIDGLWCICEESFWGVSAHNGSDHPGARPAAERPLPDVGNPYVDLFAAQSAALLSWTCHLLGEALDGVTPLLRRRVQSEVRRRVLDPFFCRGDFWWMGMIRRDVNNWTPWILSNVIACLLIWEGDDRRLAEGLARAMRMLDSYLAVMPEDGGCDEGAAYWNMAGGALLDCLELLYVATGGRAAFYDRPLIQKIGAFPLAAHIAGPYFWNFADCDAKPMLDGERVYRFGRRTGDAALMGLGARLVQTREEIFPRDTPEFSRVLNRLFCPVPVLPSKEPPAPTDVTLPHLQAGARIRGRLYAAFKGGHNGENHNHNDVGSFLLYVDGRPAVIDLGNMVYTADTFSPRRYTLPNTRSANHNLPLIGDMEQAPGAEHAARNLRWREDGLRLDIAGAYPAAAGIRALIRDFGLTAEALTVADDITLDEARAVTWVFMLRDRPALSPGRVCTGAVELRFDGALAAALEEYPVTDPRMAANFPGSVWRLTLAAVPAAEHRQRFVFAPRGAP